MINLKCLLRSSPIILSILNALYPLCRLGAYLLGYEPVLRSYSRYISLLALLMALAALLPVVSKQQPGKAAFSSLLLPLSAINGLLFILDGGGSMVIVSVLICFAAAAVIFSTCAAPVGLRVTSAVLSSLLLIALLCFSYLDLNYGDKVSQIVVISLPSPQNNYTSVLIDSDSPISGKQTLVDVHRNREPVDLYIFKAHCLPIRLYTGVYGEMETMSLEWKDDSTLIINGEEYPLEEQSLHRRLIRSPMIFLGYVKFRNFF